MAYDYQKAKEAYEALTPEQQKQYAEMNKNDTSWNYQKFMQQYNAEKSQASTIPTQTNVAKPEYQGSWNQTQVTTPYQNQWEWQYSYNEKSWYYEKQGTNTGNTATVNTWSSNMNTWTSPSYRTTVANQWNSLDYTKQQELIKKDPNLRTYLQQAGLVEKSAPQTSAETPTTPTKPETPKTWNGWDYQDNSDARMSEIANHLIEYRQTMPQLFQNYDDFYNFFIAWKWRSQEQIDFLNSYFNNAKKYDWYDSMSAPVVWDMIARWEVPDDYLNYVKYTDPQRYAEIMDAKDKSEKWIMNESYYNTLLENSWNPDWLKWAKENYFLIDTNLDNIDDRLYHWMSDEEKSYRDEAAQLEADNLKMQETIRYMDEDLIDQYPDADYSTIMLLRSDRSSKIQKKIDDNNVTLTKLQWMINYMQSERQQQDKAWQNTIKQLQDAYGMYYKYTPEWMSELAQAQYAATNVTLDQADSWTYTQKQMALESVLSPIYEQYGSIIQRPMAQVVNDVIAYAQNKWISLSQALDENFMTPLKSKPAYKSMSTYTYTPDVFKIWENSYWYWDQDWKLVKIWDITWTWVWTMRSERNNNPTAMITAYAKQLWGIEWVDYVQWDSFTSVDENWVEHTYYTAKLLGDPIDTTIRLIDRWVDNNVKKNVFSAWSYADQLWMTNDKWKNMSREEKEALILKMLQHEGWDISKMAYYNETPTAWWYNDNLVEIYKMWRDKPDTSSAQKDFWNMYWDEIEKAWVSRSDFLKQYDAWYEEETADAYLDILSHLDQLIELTWDEFDLWERSAAILWAWDVWAAYDYIKNNLTVQWLTEAKQQWLKLWVLSDSDVRMIAKASTTLWPLQWWWSWKKELYDFRQKLLNKNKYLKQKYENKSAYSDDVSITYDSKNRKFTIWTTETVETQPKDIKNMWK